MASKGKNRAVSEDMNSSPGIETAIDASAITSPSAVPSPVRKSKKGFTKRCPVCQDDIPTRLLSSHAIFEQERLEELSKQIPDHIDIPDSLDTPGAGPSTRRGAAVKARKSITNGKSPYSATASSLAEADKTIKLLRRHRRARNAKARDFSKAVLDDVDRRMQNTTGSESQQCPVCQLDIPLIEGGETMPEHVERCIKESVASEEHRLAELQLQEQRQSSSHDGELYEMNGVTRIRLTSLTGFAGTGFSIRNPADKDVDEDLDIEGADEDEFGDPQFDEGDVIVEETPSQGEGMDENDVPQSAALEPPDTSQAPSRTRTLRELVAEGKVSRNEPHGVLSLGNKTKDPSDLAITAAMSSGDKDALITALRQKIDTLVGFSFESSILKAPG
ncbi:hypothetical protein DL93DRAFT_214941 [Clavulina sp. PMI_390]|nr:hypothetical protein DL93DRAFT_214941 [Clavulina sp. PMI_390]